ncbi:MAG TPA: carbohydrate-binding family 9-like protein [Dissulfurispiraceae bacterium]|nr:carbohydrate-binding family 9-like protein [Dissulfurispiraceae bacterium]
MYLVRLTEQLPQMSGEWNSPAWLRAETLELLHFRPEGSDHRPRTWVRLLYNRNGFFGIFRVEDRYVRAIQTHYGDSVYKDSCVEFFVKPGRDPGYFNFEFSCGGTFLCSYITDPERTVDGFREFVSIPENDARLVAVHHSLPYVVDPEIVDPVIWTLEFFIPFALLGKYARPLGGSPGREWTANFYKCGDETSHPHWASWQPLPKLNFHMPECFGAISFEGF